MITVRNYFSHIFFTDYYFRFGFNRNILFYLYFPKLNLRQPVAGPNTHYIKTAPDMTHKSQILRHSINQNTLNKLPETSC